MMSLFSGQNEELDTQDLRNWLNYTPLSNTEPCLASLNFAISEKDIMETGTAISVASLYRRGMDTGLDNIPAYQCVGRVPESLDIGEEPIHYCISEDFIIPAVQRLNTALRDIDEVFNSRSTRASLLNSNDKATDSGLVL